MDVVDWFKNIITIISFVDFIVFTLLFVLYLLVIQLKAKEYGTVVLSFIILLCFLIFKILHVPIFLLTTSLIQIDIPYTTEILLSLTWINILLAFFPIVFGCITIVRYREKGTEDIAEYKKKRVNILMPIYNENPNDLLRAIRSITNLDYDLTKICVYLSFDNLVEDDAYRTVLSNLDRGVYVNENRVDGVYRGVLIRMCKFEHGGKKSAQEGGYKMILNDQIYLNESLILLMDSDIELKNDCLWQFTRHLELYNKTSLTGMITCSQNHKINFLSYYQDIEYVSGQIMWRGLENHFGSTSCLPGAFTIIKFSTFEKIASEYFCKRTYKDTFEYQRYYLGEDRYLTHLLMTKESWKIGFCEKARCKTVAPKTIDGLLKQRKRWFLGHISNDTWMLCSPKIWWRYPILTLCNFLNNSRNSSIYIYLLYFALLFNKNINTIVWLMYIIVPVLLNWLFIIYYAYRLNRKMNILFYISIIICQPIFNMMYIYYTLYNFRKRSWGGVRVESKI